MSVSSESQSTSPHTYEAVSPVDIVRGHNHFPMTASSQPGGARTERSSSESSVSSSLRSPRTARFAEATSVHSPTEPRGASTSPFADPPGHSQSQPDVSDVGFGYVAASGSHLSEFQGQRQRSRPLGLVVQAEPPRAIIP